MIIKSKNFHMILGDGDGLCLGQVQTNYNKEIGKYPQVVVGEDFLIEVANFAINLAEKNLEHFNKLRETELIVEKYYKNKPNYKINKNKNGIILFSN